jgi:IMP dehydrogenase
MSDISDKVSRTFAEYRFLCGLTPEGLTKDSIDLSTIITKDTKRRKGIRLNRPVLSAAMQSVTGPAMAVALAQQGGLGVIYCSQPIEEEALMVKAVKRARAGFVSQLEVMNYARTVGDTATLIERSGYNTIPIVMGDKTNYGLLIGVVEGPIPDTVPRSELVTAVTRPFVKQDIEDILIKILGKNRSSRRKQAKQIITAVSNYLPYGESGMSLQEANLVMEKSGRKYLPIVNADGTLKFMVFLKDLQAHTEFPNAVVDGNKRYLVGAAINTHDYTERVPALAEAGVDVLLIDASDGYTSYQKKCIQFVKSGFDIPIIAGNIITGKAFDWLAPLGIDGIKVGMGGGSICITQEQKGTGRGQATAVGEVSRHRNRYHGKKKVYIPIISDGGIVNAKDISMALAFGADAVMMGQYFAGCRESPSDLIERDGKRYKEYWGEGSFRAKAWLKKRYGQTEFEEGVVSLVPYTGRVGDKLQETFAKIYATMVSVGAWNIPEFRDARVELISDASRIEGNVHDVITTGTSKK